MPGRIGKADDKSDDHHRCPLADPDRLRKALPGVDIELDPADPILDPNSDPRANRLAQ
jgi:hypothetical protein